MMNMQISRDESPPGDFKTCGIREHTRAVARGEVTKQSRTAAAAHTSGPQEVPEPERGQQSYSVVEVRGEETENKTKMRKL